jgi:LysR family glycine cleavage system transcriptional activator
VLADGALALDAAAIGQGVALARAALVEDDLRAGRLVRLSRLAVKDVYAYYFVWRTDGRAQAARELFREWLLAASAHDLRRRRLRPA